MLTREDSMAIANAVASRMAARPAPVPARGATRRGDSIATVALMDSMRLQIQRAIFDSMLKVEANRSLVDVRMPNVGTAINTALAIAEAAELAATTRVSTGPRRVVIAMPRPSRSRPEADALASVLADSLRARLGADARYILVPADSVATVLRESRTVNTVQEKLNADLILSIALVPLKGDTLMRMVQMRDLRAPNGFNYRVVTGSGVMGGSPSAGVSEMMPKVQHQLEDMQNRPARTRPPSAAPRPPRASVPPQPRP
jgi:hypothetical protein